MVPHSVLGSSVDSSPYPEVPLMGGGIILFSRDTLTSEEIFDALLHASDQQISNVPPIKPAGGESYIIECPTSQDCRSRRDHPVCEVFNYGRCCQAFAYKKAIIISTGPES